MVASTRQEAPERRFGNRVTSRFVWLPTHIEDPVLRLLAAHEAASAAKHDIELSAGAHLEDWLEHLPPLFVKIFSRALRFVTRIKTVPGLVVVSNVPGPSQVLYAGDAPIESFISVGHMKFIAGLNITVWSYADQLNLALYADARCLPDAGRLARHLEEAFDELALAAQAKRAKAA
jgi:diacylglycerol O-acyltransferase